MTTETLQDLVAGRLAELGSPGRPMSGRQAAERSGGRVSHSTINNIVNGKHSGRLDDRTIEGLALALDVTRSRVERAAGLYREGRPAAPFQLPPRANRLTLRERRLVIEVMDSLLAAREEGRQEAGQPMPEPAPELRPEDMEFVVIERPGRPPFSVARARARGPMSEHERAQHIARVEALERQTQEADASDQQQENP